MAVKIFQFLSIVLTALALIPAGAHLLALPNKIGLDRAAYLTVQQIYSGWALAGVVVVAALVGSGILAFVSRSQVQPMILAISGTGLISATLVTFFLFIFPANQATENWTRLPENWETLRARWEYTHAVNSGITFFALICVVLSALSWSE
jgi:hypothetical protein